MSILFFVVIVLTCGIIAHFLTNLVRKKISSEVAVNIAFFVFIFLLLLLFYMWGSHPSKTLRPSNFQGSHQMRGGE